MLNKKGIIILLIILINSFTFSKTENKQDVEQRYVELVIESVMNLIDENFVLTYEKQDKVTKEKLLQGALKGMISVLDDPHTTYFEKKELESFEEDMEGEFVGVGMVINKKQDEALLVVSPIEDTPAFRAGIKPKDRILEINGESTIPLTSEECQKKLRGAKDTTVNIKIYRESIDKTIDITLKRDIIELKYVKSKMLDNKIGYVRLTQFSSNVSKDIEKSIINLKKQGMKGLIFDLRTNPGGQLAEAIKVASLFIKEGKIVSMKDAKGKEYVYKREGDYLGDFPLVILINEGSASASEIVSGAIKDYKRGLLVGEKSFGKGSVQNIFYLANGDGIKLTIAKYFTPNGESIHEKGIMPDVEVKEKDDFLFFEGTLTNVEESSLEETKHEIIDAIGKSEGEEKKKELEEKKDEQLIMAESILKGIILYNTK
ncbi:S41A family C-terminal processing peptidase-3 [Hypnocyclicus thermotrophus]|uniref:S41A family C-terminal processing peptidase-3 n=1 Tax=Hypnocyclicus thermotrophus TaxID=1627895 RepID=A0AA46DY97_9FUSO|nr:S41 family peptidase [Hypnocyclicus thermotrophus]TDT69756.1 S41A family C-terminal processing peptidase-3 [Hypnocyclicus thermotrophus]